MDVQDAIGSLNKTKDFRNPKGFPTDNVSPKVKQKKPWCKAMLEAIHSQGERGEAATYYHRNRSEMQIDRSYAQGRQDIDQYKTALNIRKQQGKGYQSYRNLDFAILGFGKKFKAALKGKIRKRKLFANIEAIDEGAKLHSRRVKAQYEEYLINKSFLEKMSKYNLQTPTPLDEGEPEPETMEDIEINMQLFPKQRYILEAHSMLELVNTVNNRNQVDDELLDDLVEVGVIISKSSTTKDGFERLRRCIPENCTSNNHIKKDGSDIWYFGEYREMTIQELKIEAQDEFTEEEYKDIAEKASGKRWGAEQHHYAPLNAYPYDSEKILVLDAEWISSDNLTYLIKTDENGNISKVIERNYGFPSNPDGTPRSDEDYAQEYPDRKIYRQRVNNVYKGKMIVNTEYCFDYGLATDMERVLNQLEEVKLNYKVYNLFDSPFRAARPLLDQIQINWLRFQHHVAQSRVGGMAIEMSAFENITLGPNGNKLKPRQALDLYFETGILFWRSKNFRGGQSGQRWKPIEEMNNAMNQGAEFHFQKIIQLLGMMRDILGLNEVTDASTPSPETGKAVGEFMIQGTEDVLDELYEARRKHAEMTDQRILYQIPIALKITKHPGLINALGLSSYNFMVNNSEIGMHEYSIKYELSMDNEKRYRLQSYLQTQLKSNNGMFDVDEIIEFENDDNYMRAVMRLRMAKNRKMKELAQRQQSIDEANTQRQIQSSQAATQAEMQKIEHEHMFKKDFEQFKSQLDVAADRQKTLNAAITKKLELGQALTKMEQEHLNKIAQIRETKKWEALIADKKQSQAASSQRNVVPSQ